MVEKYQRHFDTVLNLTSPRLVSILVSIARPKSSKLVQIDANIGPENKYLILTSWRDNAGGV